MTFNHKLESRKITYTAKTGSRNRLRIPVQGTRHSEIKPGDRVNVFYNRTLIEVSIVKDPKGNYKVEKDGAIRFPAHKYSLAAENNIIMADSLHKKVSCI
jgi:hypothetical protein